MGLPQSFFVSPSVVERKVQLGDGEEHVLHFKELPHTSFRKLVEAERSEDEDERAAAMSRLIASSMCEADGKPALTSKEASLLKPTVANAIVDEILDLNGVKKKKGNASPPGAMDGSGTSSPSPSEGGQ